jgi:hypothetical protein
MAPNDINSIDDRNVSVALNWRIADNWDANLRWNDRKSDRVIGQAVLVDQGPLGERGMINSSKYAYGIRPVAPGTPGALPFTHPVTGDPRFGAPIRPGVDTAATHRPNSFLWRDWSASRQRHRRPRRLRRHQRRQQRAFRAQRHPGGSHLGHQRHHSLKYIGGWMDFDYTFDIDNDWTNGTVSEFRQTVLEAVETHSHELQLLWQIGDQLQMTSGVYYFNSDRLQNYAFKDLASQGRYTQPVNYGSMARLRHLCAPSASGRRASCSASASAPGKGTRTAPSTSM